MALNVANWKKKKKLSVFQVFQVFQVFRVAQAAPWLKFCSSFGLVLSSFEFQWHMRRFHGKGVVT